MLAKIFFHNSLDEQFVETGYQHLPATLKRRRPALYRIEGTTVHEGAVREVRRIARSGHIVGIAA